MNCIFKRNGIEYSTRTRAIRGNDILDDNDSILDRLIDNMDSDGFFFKDSFFKNDSIDNIKNIAFKLNDLFNKNATLSKRRQSVKYFLDIMVDKNIRTAIKKNIQQKNKFAEDILLDTINQLVNNNDVSNLNETVVDLAKGIIRMFNHINTDTSVLLTLSQLNFDASSNISMQDEIKEEEVDDSDENIVEENIVKKIIYNNSEMNTLMSNKYGSMDIITMFTNSLRYSLMNYNSPYGTTISTITTGNIKDGIYEIYKNLKKGIFLDTNYFDGLKFPVIRVVNDENGMREEKVMVEPSEITREDISRGKIPNTTKIAYILYNMMPNEYRSKNAEDITREERNANEQELMYFINTAFPTLDAGRIINKKLENEDSVHNTSTERYTDQYAPEDAIPTIYKYVMGTIPLDYKKPSAGFVSYSMVREIFYTLTLYEKGGRFNKQFDIRNFIHSLKDQLNDNIKEGGAIMFSARDYKRKAAEAIVAHFERELDVKMLKQGVIKAGLFWFANGNNIKRFVGYKNEQGEYINGVLDTVKFSDDEKTNLKIINKLKRNLSEKSNAVNNLLRAIENVYTNINEDPISYIDKNGVEQVQTYISKLRQTYEYRTNIEEYWGGKTLHNQEIGFQLKNNVFGENRKIILSLEESGKNKGKYKDEITIFTKKDGKDISYTITRQVPTTEAELKEYVDNIKEGFRRLGLVNIDTYFVEYLDRINSFEDRLKKLKTGDVFESLHSLVSMAYTNYNTIEKSRELLNSIQEVNENNYEIIGTEEYSDIEHNNKQIYRKVNEIKELERRKNRYVRTTDYGDALLRIGDSGWVKLYNAPQYKIFFNTYVESLYKFDNYIGDVIGKTGDGKYQSIINTASPYHLTTKTSNAIVKSIRERYINDGKVKLANDIDSDISSYNDEAINQVNDNLSKIYPEVEALNNKEFVNSYINKFLDSPLITEGIKRFGSKENLIQRISDQIVRQNGITNQWWRDKTNWFTNDLTSDELVQILTDSLLNKYNLKNYFIYNTVFNSKYDNNLIKKGLIRFKDDALLDGGIEGSYQGKKQHELSTTDFLNKMFNNDIKNAIFGKLQSFQSLQDNQPMTMFTMTDMFGERKSMYKREWYWHGEKPLYQISLSDDLNGYSIKSLTRNEDQLMIAYTSIADYYKSMQDEAFAILENSGIIIEDGLLKSSVILEDGTIAYQEIEEKESYKYRELVKNQHFIIKNVDGKSLVAPGNIFNLENLPLPKELMKSLIDRTATYKDVIKAYIEPQALEIAEMMSDIKLDRKFNDLLNIEGALKETQQVLDELYDKNPELYPKSREEYKEIIGKIKDIQLTIKYFNEELDKLEDGIYETEQELNKYHEDKNKLLQLKLDALNEKIALQEKINNYKKVFSKTISKSTATKLSSDTDVNILLEYAINSFFLYNESVAQVVKGGSTYFSNLADEIKRGMGVTSPRLAFSTRTKRDVSEELNVIYTSDIGGEMLGSYDSEAMTNGNVLVNPLLYERLLYSTGYEFSSFDKGQIKINLFDSGYSGSKPAYIKMSAYTLRKHEVSARGQFHLQALKAFLDKDISLIKMATTEKVGEINLYKKYGKKILEAKSNNQLFKLYKIINDDITNLSGNYTFSTNELEMGINDSSKITEEATNLFTLLPHMIVPASAAKTYAKNIIHLISMDNDMSKISSSLPTHTEDGYAINDKINMVGVSSQNLGVQGNKQHDILSEKSIPIQILNFISAIDKSSFQQITKSLSSIINDKTNRIEELYLKGDYAEILRIYRKKTYGSKMAQEKSFSTISLYGNNSLDNDVILSDIIRTMMVDINRINKPSMPGSSFVQVPALYNLYFDKTTGQAYYASELGLENDQIDDLSDEVDVEEITIDEEGNEVKTITKNIGNKYERRKLKPFSFYVNGEQVKTKEELLKLIDKKADIEIRHQEVIMDFPYRNRFHIGKYDTLDQSTRFKGFSFLYPVSISLNKDERRKYIQNKVNEFIEKDTDVNLILEDFKTSKGLYKYFKTATDINDLKIKMEEHFYHLNEALFIYPLRIPTTNMSSGFPSRIVAFANGIENSLIIPAEKSILDGSDFDIDELQTYYKPIINDNSKLANEDVFFEAIMDSYFKTENIKYIIQEISYKKIVQDTNALNDEADKRKCIMSSSIINMFTAREKMLVGKAMVGFKVNEQQSSLLATAMSDVVNETILPITKEKDGLLKMIDLYSAYVNLSTDNGKLDGVLGRLGHNTAFIQLEIGLIGKGLNLDKNQLKNISEEEYKSLLNKKLYDIYNSEILRKSIERFNKSSSVLSGGYFIPFETILLSEIEKVKQDNENYQLAQEIYDALALGTAVGRLYQFNLTREVKTSAYDAYKLYRNLSFSLGQDISEYSIESNINENKDIESQLQFVGEQNNNFEKKVRESINISKYIKQNELLFSQLRIFAINYNSVIRNSEKMKLFEKISNDYNAGKNNSSYDERTLNENRYNAVIKSAESLLITDFIKHGNYNDGKISLQIEDNSKDSGYKIMEYDLSNYNDIMAFMTDFPEFVKLAKTEYRHKSNTEVNKFIDRLMIKTFNDGSYEIKIKNSDSMDDDTFVDDYINNFNELPDDVKKAFSIYGLLANGFTEKKNSLIRFMNKDILLEYSNYRKNARSFELNDNESYASLMSSEALQNNNKKGSVFGYAKKPIKHSFNYGVTFIKGNEIKVLNTFPNSYLLSEESIVNNNTYFRFNAEQERKLKNGIAFEFTTNFAIDEFKQNNSNPIEKNANNIPKNRSNINHSKYNTFILEKISHNRYIVLPINKNDRIEKLTKEERISYNGKELVGYFDSIISNFFNDKVKYGSTVRPILKNGELHLGIDNQILLNNILNKPEILLFLNSNNRNNYYVDFMNHVETLFNNEDLNNSMATLLGVSKLKKVILASFILRNNTKINLRNMVVSLSKGITKESNTIIEAITTEILDSAKLFIYNAQITMVNSISNDLIKTSYDKLINLIDNNKLRFVDIIQEQVNSDFIIKNEFKNEAVIKPSQEIIELKQEIEEGKKDLETMRCSLINQ